jgi:5'-nucleotidase
MRTTRFAIVALLVCCLASPFEAQAPYRILVTNDDGVRSPGLQAVAESLRSIGEVTIVAPADNQSAKGTSLTINDPIVQENLTLPNGMAAIGLTATPATTVKVALTKILMSPPNLVVSGINRGTNMGLAAYISGTVGAAREAAARGIPAIASSLAYAAAGDVASYKAAAEATLRVATLVKAQGLPQGVLLNVNVPAGTMQTFKGIRVTTQGTATGGDESFDVRVHPTSKRTYYWNVFIEGGKDVEGTDTWAVENGYVAVTPLKVGEFDQASFDKLKTVIK